MSCVTDGLKKLEKSLSPQEKGYLDFSLATFQCLESFLYFIAANPVLLSQFKTLLQGATAAIDAMIATVQLMIAGLDVQNQIINAIIQPFRALREQTKGQVGVFVAPFKQFERCPPILGIKNSLLNNFKSLNKIPGSSKLRAVDNWVKTKEYQALAMRNYAQDLNKVVERMRASQKLFQTIVDTITDCFES